MSTAAGLSLICRIRRILIALPIEHLIETMRPLKVEPLAGLPPFVRGLSLIRGTPTPVVDVGALLGCTEEPGPTRFVTIRIGGRFAALAVESVLDFRRLSPAAAAEVPRLLRSASAEALAAVAALDAQLLFVLEAARLVPESVWPAAESATRDGP